MNSERRFRWNRPARVLCLGFVVLVGSDFTNPRIYSDTFYLGFPLHTIEKTDSNGKQSVFATGLNDPQFIAILVPEPSTWALVAIGIVAILVSQSVSSRLFSRQWGLAMNAQRYSCLSHPSKALSLGLVLLTCFFFTNACMYADTIYVANYLQNAVEKFDSNGPGSIFVSGGMLW